MRRALIVAGAEVRALVRTRSFLIGLVLPPLLGVVIGSITFVTAPRPGPPGPVRFALSDGAAGFAEAFERAASERSQRAALEGALPRRPYRLVAIPPPGATRADLERRLRGGEIDAFVETPSDASAEGAALRLRVTTLGPPSGEFLDWAEGVAAAELRRRAGRSLPPELRAALERPVRAEPAPIQEPLARASARALGPAKGLLVTAPLALVVFLVTTLTAAPLFQAVIEEKSSRVAELLASSISPFELMLGKLLGGLAAGGVAGTAYAAVCLGSVTAFLGAEVSPGIVALFLLYLALGALLTGAIFLAIGAACVDVKDSQNLMLPVALVNTLPIFFVNPIMARPDGGLALAASLFPPSAPFVMLLRLGLEPRPGALEIGLSLGLLAAAATACVWAAGRVFRVGLLVQGRSARPREILRWIVSG